MFAASHRLGDSKVMQLLLARNRLAEMFRDTSKQGN